MASAAITILARVLTLLVQLAPILSTGTGIATIPSISLLVHLASRSDWAKNRGYKLYLLLASSIILILILTLWLLLRLLLRLLLLLLLLLQLLLVCVLILLVVPLISSSDTFFCSRAKDRVHNYSYTDAYDDSCYCDYYCYQCSY